MQKATLKFWHMTDDNRLTGIVYDHPKHPNGCTVTTSVIKDLHPNLEMVTTRNTLYKLENKASTLQTLLSALEEVSMENERLKKELSTINHPHTQHG